MPPGLNLRIFAVCLYNPVSASAECTIENDSPKSTPATAQLYHRISPVTPIHWKSYTSVGYSQLDAAELHPYPATPAKFQKDRKNLEHALAPHPALPPPEHTNLVIFVPNSWLPLIRTICCKGQLLQRAGWLALTFTDGNQIRHDTL